MYYLECCLERGQVVKMLFLNKRQAENARRKIVKAAASAKFSNRGDFIEIKSDASTYSVIPSAVVSISVNDSDAWDAETSRRIKVAKDLGIPVVNADG